MAGLPAEVEVLLLEPVAQPFDFVERRLQISLSLAVRGDVLYGPNEAHRSLTARGSRSRREMWRTQIHPRRWCW